VVGWGWIYLVDFVIRVFVYQRLCSLIELIYGVSSKDLQQGCQPRKTKWPSNRIAGSGAGAGAGADGCSGTLRAAKGKILYNGL